MERKQIPVSAEPVDDCNDCDAACCRANTILSLSFQEAALMTRCGNKLITVALPSSKDRTNVIYPFGAQFDPISNAWEFVLQPGNEYEPLAANLGRYMLLNDCKYLGVDETGWEHCTIYEDRPQVCQDFEPGGAACHLIQRVH